MKVTKLFFSLVFILIVAGCSGHLGADETRVYETKHPDAKEVLTLNPDADIFQFDGLIYQTNVDWVEELHLTKDKQIGEITKQNNTDTDFEDGMSNKLPVGAKIFSTKGTRGLLIVEFEEKTLKYLAHVEG